LEVTDLVSTVQVQPPMHTKTLVLNGVWVKAQPTKATVKLDPKKMN